MIPRFSASKAAIEMGQLTGGGTHFLWPRFGLERTSEYGKPRFVAAKQRLALSPPRYTFESSSTLAHATHFLSLKLSYTSQPA